MSSDNSNKKVEISGALSSLNIGSNDSNDEEKVANNTDINTTAITTCAACGKEGKERMNSCNKCDLVVYCNAACKKKHRSRHKKKCEIRAAELHDERLFEEPPPPEDCPICMLPPPLYEDHTGMAFFTCCGKLICNGCIYAMDESGAKRLCAYCRTPYAKSDEDDVESLKKLMEKGNAEAFHQLASYYANGSRGMPQNQAKANELYLKAGELGCALAYSNLGNSYNAGTGVEIDKEKAKHYYELAAMKGSVQARGKLGAIEYNAGNHQRAFKHFIISARAGNANALKIVKQVFMKGFITKDEYANTLREYQKSQHEMKSEARDKAQAFRNQRMGV